MKVVAKTIGEARPVNEMIEAEVGFSQRNNGPVMVVRLLNQNLKICAYTTSSPETRIYWGVDFCNTATDEMYSLEVEYEEGDDMSTIDDSTLDHETVYIQCNNEYTFFRTHYGNITWR